MKGGDERGGEVERDSVNPLKLWGWIETPRGTHSSTSRTLVPLPRAIVMTRFVRPIGLPSFPRRTWIV